MKQKLFVTAAFAAVLSTNALAEIDEAQQDVFAADCRKNAQEESVPAEEMDSYIVQCIQDMAAAESWDKAEASESESNKE